MTGLLHVDACAILAYRLVGLTENRIERLLKDLLFVEEGEVVGHEELHAFEGVLDGGSLVQEDNHCGLQGGHQLEG